MTRTDYQTALLEAADTAVEKEQQERADELLLLAGADDDDDKTEPTQQASSVFSGLEDRILANIEEDEIDWLWRNWLELGNISFFVGTAGGGKSTVMSDLVTRVTRGAAMPDGTPCEAPGGAVVISLEEKTAATVLPRLRRAGADLTRVIDLSRVPRRIKQPGDPSASPFMLPDDLPILRQAVRLVKATLVVIDPLMSAVNPRVSTFRNQSARQVVGAFQEMAEDLGIAVVIVNHFTKGTLKDPLSAMAGSKGFTDMVRSVMMLTPDASDPKRRTLSLIKHNNAPDVPDLVLVHNGATVKYLQGVTVEQARRDEAVLLSETRQHVLALLSAQPAKPFTPSEVAQTLDVPYNTAKSVMRRMAEADQINRLAHGMYQSAAPSQGAAPSAPSAP